MKKFLAILGVVFMTVVFTAGLSFSADVVKWKFQVAYPPGDATYDIFAKETVKLIEKASGGKIKVDLFAPGALCTVPEMVNALSKGMIDIMIGYGPAYAGAVPVGDIEGGMPFSWSNMDQASELFWGSNYRLIDTIREGYAKKNIFYLCPNAGGSYNFMLTFPLHKFSDFKGHKIRGMGATGEWLKKAGAVATPMPGAEIYMAMKLGTIDGTPFTPMILETLKLKEVVKYLIFPHFIWPVVVCTLVNMDSWKALPVAVQKELTDNKKIIEFFLANGRAYKVRDEEAIREAIKYGVKTITLPDDEMKEGRRLALGVWDMVAAKDPLSKKAAEILKRYVAEKGLM